MQKCPQKSLAAQGFSRAKRLHCVLFLLFSALTHPCCGLLSACCFGAAFRAVHPLPINGKQIAALLADGGRRVGEYGFQLRVCGQQRISEAPAQSTVCIADTKHRTLTVQWQAAVFSVMVGTPGSDQLLDSLFLPACQLTMIVGHRQFLLSLMSEVIYCKTKYITPSLIGEIEGV